MVGCCGTEVTVQPTRVLLSNAATCHPRLAPSSSSGGPAPAAGMPSQAPLTPQPGRLAAALPVVWARAGGEGERHRQHQNPLPPRPRGVARSSCLGAVRLECHKLHTRAALHACANECIQACTSLAGSKQPVQQMQGLTPQRHGSVGAGSAGAAGTAGTADNSRGSGPAVAAPGMGVQVNEYWLLRRPAADAGTARQQQIAGSVKVGSARLVVAVPPRALPVSRSMCTCHPPREPFPAATVGAHTCGLQRGQAEHAELEAADEQ